jgi:hypothetical protein
MKDYAKLTAEHERVRAERARIKREQVERRKGFSLFDDAFPPAPVIGLTEKQEEWQAHDDMVRRSEGG